MRKLFSPEIDKDPPNWYMGTVATLQVINIAMGWLIAISCFVLAWVS